MSGALNASHFSRAILRHSLPRLKGLIPNSQLPGLFLISMKACFMAKAEVTDVPERWALTSDDVSYTEKAMSMAKRGGQKLVSLGNGFIA